MGLAVGVTIALGQPLRCLHPPAGAVALLGVLFSRLRPCDDPFPTTGSDQAAQVLQIASA